MTRTPPPTPAWPAAVLLAPLLIAGCVAAPEAPPPPPPPAAVPAPPPPPPAADWQDRRVTPGSWRYGRVAGGSRASFGDVLSMACDPSARAVTLAAAPGLVGPVTVRTSSTTRSLPVAADGTLRLGARDPLFDAMAFSRGRFTVEQPGRAPLVLPPQAEVGRVIEDCRA